MKKYRLSLILLTLLLITLFSSFQISNVLSSSTINYTFNSTEVYNKSNPSFNSTYNVRNQTITGGFYNATYSFTDDDDDTTPDDFFSDETGGTVRVINNYASHNKVLRLFDDSANSVEAEQVGSQQISGSHEFWFQTDDATSRNYIAGKGITDWRYQVYTYTETFWYNDGAVHDTVITCLDDTWYHIRIDFEHGGGGYLGLSPDTWNLKIDGVLIGTYSFHTAGVFIDRFLLQTSGAENNYNAYYDAIGFSARSFYDVGENLFPNSSMTDTQEVDKWEFVYDSNGNPVDMGTYDIPYWTDTSGTPYISPLWTSDGASVGFGAYSTTHFTLEHEFSENYGFIDVNFKVGFYSHIDSGFIHYYDFNIYSADSTLIARIRLFGESTLDWTYYDGSNYIVLYENFHSVMGSVSFNLLFRNGSIRITSSLFDTAIISKINTAKEGLSKIEIDTYASGGSTGTNMYVDNIGCYINGVSITQDVATYSLTGVSWNLELPTFIEFTATGLFSLSFTSEIPITFSILSFNEYNGHNKFFDEYITTYNSSNGVIKFTANQSFTLESLSIYQIYLTSPIDNYYIDFDFGGTTVNESYFYVDSSHRLRFSLYVNDNDSEYIEITFNIPDIPSENRSMSFRSNINGQSQGYFRVQYSDDTSTFIPLPTWLSTSNYILPQTKQIIKIGLLITDNDNDDNDYCSGYITNLQLIYYTGMAVKITTLNLIMVMIPIIVMLVPTFGVSARYGKNTILPMFILMSIICFATGLIPVWVFFIIAVSCGAFLFMKQKRGFN